jgi:hypothetical protein
MYGDVKERSGSFRASHTLAECDSDLLESEQDSEPDTQRELESFDKVNESIKRLVRRLGSCPNSSDPIKAARLMHNWIESEEGSMFTSGAVSTTRQAWGSLSKHSQGNKFDENAMIEEVLDSTIVDPSAIPHRVSHRH